LQTPDATLHGFVLNLLSDADLQHAFDADPVQALSAAGLPDVTPQDVLDAVPLVMDFASSSDQSLSADLHGLAGTSGVSGWGGVESAFGGGSGAVDVTTDGVSSHGGFGIHDVAGGSWNFSGGTDGMSAEGSFESPLGGGSFAFQAGLDGFDGELQLSGLSSDTIGKGGDLVTGTVAGFATDGASNLTGMLTDGAAALSQNLDAGTAAGLVSDGTAMLSETLQDPTSLHVPSLPAVGLPDVAQDLPVDTSALPALPAVPSLPDLGDLPVLGDLGHGLPNLPVDLPQLPVDLPDLTQNLPAVPQLPSLPDVDAVHGTVAGVTSNVPLVGDLTDGLTDHLGLLGH
jgi:hypothetical protein